MDENPGTPEGGSPPEAPASEASEPQDYVRTPGGPVGHTEPVDPVEYGVLTQGGEPAANPNDMRNPESQKLADLELIVANLRQARSNLAGVKVAFRLKKAGVKIELPGGKNHDNQIAEAIREAQRQVDALVAMAVEAEASETGLPLPPTVVVPSVALPEELQGGIEL
jgi:hypothetical protein